MRIADNVEMLEVPTGKGTVIYPVMLWEKPSYGNHILIDTGYPGETMSLLDTMAGSKLFAGLLTHIILTHQDLDHIGNVTELLKIAPGAKVWAHRDEAPYIDGRIDPIKGFPSQKIQISDELDDGDYSSMHEGFTVIHTPGHTPGHICIFLRKSKILICGDAVNIKDGRLTGSNPIHTHDMALAEQSFEKIKTLGAKAIVSYHGGYIDLMKQ